MHFTHISLLVVIQRLTGQALAQIDLGTAASFGVIASTAISNTGATIVTGDLGLFPNSGSSITGFPPGLSGVVYAGNGVADQALQDARTAYNTVASLASTSQVAEADLGGQRLVPGTYTSASSVLITGALTLDGQDNPDALFVFQIGSTLTTASSSSIVLVNGARACNVFFQIGSSATLGSSTSFNGNILALTSISLLDDVSVSGGLYALEGAVTLINDRIASQPRCAAVTTSSIPAVSSPTLPGLSITQTSLENEASSMIPGDDMTIPMSIQTSTSTSLDQPGLSDTAVIPNVPVTSTVPRVPVTTPVPDAPGTPVIPNTPTLPNLPNVSTIPSLSGTLSMESSTISMDSASASSSEVSTSIRSSSMSTTSTRLSRSSNTPALSTKSLSTQTISTMIFSTVTFSTAASSRSTKSTSRSRSGRSAGYSEFSTSTTTTRSKTKFYPVYKSTNVWKSIKPTHSGSRPYHQQSYATDGTTATSTAPATTTMINGIPCTNLSYYEASCASTRTTVVPISYTPEPSFEAAHLVTVSGIPCTTSRYYEPTCDCIRASNVPIKVVAATISIETVISDVPYITSKYFEHACNCVQTATIPVRVATAGESIEATRKAVCAGTYSIPSSCTISCLQPSATTITSSY